MNAFKIMDVNGVRDLTITLDGPGVYVARGPNGVGKSSALEALKAATGDSSAKAEPSDGEAKGQVVGGGVVFAVGHRRKLDGTPQVRLISTGAIGSLIDPGIKDTHLAAKARLKALLKLMPLPADDAAKMELTDNDEELQLWIKGDPSTDAMDLGEAVRHRANALANDLEKRSAEACGEERSLTDLILGLGTLDFESGDLASAQAEASRLIRDAEVKAHTSRARLALEEQQAAIRHSLGPRPDPAAMEVELGRQNMVAIELERQATEARALWRAVGEKVKALRLAEHQWSVQAEILNRKPEGPTPAEAQEAAELASAAAERAERARRVDTAKGYQVKANAAKEAGIQCAGRAKRLRSIAKETATALGRLLERRGLPGLAIIDGRLAVKDGLLLKDFETRMSFGERVRTALGIALMGIEGTHQPGLTAERMPILPLDATFWLALDQQHKAEVSAIAKERGVCLVTEEPDSGPLRVERVEQTAAAK